MEKHKLYGIWHKYRTLSLLIIITGLVFFGFLSVLALRQNNLKMLQLKETVIKVDESGGDVEQALTDLRNHVFSHMNTNMRTSDSSELPIQLASRYNKYIAEQQAKLTASGQADIYTKAQASCEQTSPTLTERVNCIQIYVAENGGQLSEINFPPKDLYTFDFASPKWSPDVAGFSIVLTIIFTVLLIIRLILGFIIKSYLS